jgi:hypothetical protein
MPFGLVAGRPNISRSGNQQERPMSLIKPILTVAALAAAFLSWPAGARADYAYCSVASSSTRCDFQTYEQCQATVSGLGADCIANPAGFSQAYGEKPPVQQLPSRRHRQ